MDTEQGQSGRHRNNSKHPLLEGRIVAAVGVAALCGGLGFTLMLAHTLILPGLFISLLGALGVGWIYFPHWSNAHRALSRNKKYKGPRASELAIAFGMVFVLVLISMLVYSGVSQGDKPSGQALIALEGVNPDRAPGEQQFFVNVVWRNLGNLTATDVKLKGIYPTAELGSERILHELASLSVALNDSDKSRQFSDIYPGKQFIVTIPDFYLSEQQINSIVQAKKARLYVLFSMNYDDDANRDVSYFHDESCVYFSYRLNIFHSCTTSRVTSSLSCF
jgi:hypothetical protein